MTPVNQRVYDKGIGDCMQCVVASLLDLPYEDVPQFVLMKNWQIHFIHFHTKHGWEYHGVMNFSLTEPNDLLLEESINGYFHASVPSRVFSNTTHSVVIDTNGIVVHDPSKYKHYQGENVIETKSLIYWFQFGYINPKDDSDIRKILNEVK
jgi:hypothetical protein